MSKQKAVRKHSLPPSSQSLILYPNLDPLYVAWRLLLHHNWLWFLFSFVNLGLGFRGPPGFYLAVLASGDNDSRGAALVMLMVFMTTALGTAALAPFITIGLVPLAITAGVISMTSIIILTLLPALPEDHGS